MKKLLAFLFLAYCSFAVAQVGVKLSYIRPTGTMGATLKPAIGGEIIYKPFSKKDQEGNHAGLKMRIGISFAKFTPRQDTFPTYGVIVSQGTTVTPGYTVIHKYNIGALSLGVDYMFRITKNFCLYTGGDVTALFTTVEYESETPLISSEGYSGGSTFIGLRLRAGAEYFTGEHISIFAEGVRSMNFSPEVGGLAYNDYGIGIRYKF